MVTWLLTGTSCQTPTTTSLEAFVEKGEWAGYALVAAEKHHIFMPDENGRATRFPYLADRIDYCEAYGVSVNEAIRGTD